MQPTQNTVLITGGTSSIGLALTGRFAHNDNTVIVTGHNMAKLAEVRTALPAVITEQADMMDISALKRLAQAYPMVNVLINNAAVQHNYDLSDPTVALDLIDSELHTNLVGPIHLVKLFLPTLLKQSQAAIVNVSSGLGFVPKQSAPVYCVSKAGLHMFTKTLRWQLDTSKVKVF